MEDKILVKQSDLITETEPLAKVFVESGMFPSVKSQAQAVVKILVGRELGMTPLESISQIYIVNGQIAMMAKGIAALIKRSKKYDYHIDTLTDEQCVISFFQLNGEKEKMGETTFTLKDAAKAGIVNKESWKAYPKNMLFARALSNGAKFYCADVFSGYTPEELEEIKVIPADSTKKVIEVTAEGEVKENGS